MPLAHQAGLAPSGGAEPRMCAEGFSATRVVAVVAVLAQMMRHRRGHVGIACQNGIHTCAHGLWVCLVSRHAASVSCRRECLHACVTRVLRRWQADVAVRRPPE